VAKLAEIVCNAACVIMSQLVNVESFEILNVSLAYSSVKLVYSILSCNESLDRKSIKPCVFHISNVLIDRLLMHLTIIIEMLKLMKKQTNYDEFTCLLFHSHALLLLLMKNHRISNIIHGSDVNLRSLSGPYLAQIVQNCLQFSKHDSKQITSSALLCLDRIIKTVNDPNVWRTYFPGTFAGLYILCRSGYKK